MRTLDPDTEAGAKALHRLDTELMGWVTSVDPDGQPHSSPIWFLWRDGAVIVYSHIRAPRNANIESNPLVSFNLNTDPDGDDVVTMEGVARIDHSLPPSSADAAFQVLAVAQLLDVRAAVEDHGLAPVPAQHRVAEHRDEGRDTGPRRDVQVGPLVVGLQEELALRPDHPHPVADRQLEEHRRERPALDEADVELVALRRGHGRR